MRWHKFAMTVMSLGMVLIVNTANADILAYEPFVGVPDEAFAGARTESINFGPWSDPVPRIASDNAQFVEFAPYTDADGAILPNKGVGAVLRGDLFDESTDLESPLTFAAGDSVWIGFQGGLRDKGGSGFDRQHSRMRFHFDASDLEVRWDTEGPGGVRDNQLIQLVLQGASGSKTRTPEDIPYPAVGEPVNEFILIRVDFAAGDETIHLWRNPSLSASPADADALLVGNQELGSVLSGITTRTQAFHTELVLDEIRIGETFHDAVGGEGPVTAARSPLPKNNSDDALYDGMTLTWRAGKFAQTHNVFLGTTFADVNNASVSNPLGVQVSEGQADNAFAPGRLDFGETYYWRVDEVNGAPDFTIYKGDVWSFTVEPISLPLGDVVASASSSFGDSGPENTVNGSGMSGDLHDNATAGMWISGAIPASIQYEFDSLQKLHEMWVWNSNQAIETFVGFGAKDVVIEHSANGTDWTLVEGATSLAQAPGTNDYLANNVIDLGGAAARHVRITINSVHGIAPQTGLSEVRFYVIPVRPREPQPSDGASDLDPAVVLGWRAGRGAVSHEIALGDDPANLTLVGTVSDNTFDTSALGLNLGETYHWAITEVNEAGSPTAWTGDTWQFSLVDALVIDDMESYRDTEFLEIWATWVDGFDDPANGALVGNGAAGAPETDLVHGGRQSLPLHFDNSASPSSEAVRTFSPAQDWSRSGVQTLALAFKRGAASAGGQLYVKVNDTKVSYPGEASALPPGWDVWTQWNIDLATLGTDVSRVNSLTLGVEGGGSGVYYIDDIELYRNAPPAGADEVVAWFEAESGTLTEPMKQFVGDPTASGQIHIGTDELIGDENNNPPADGVATYTLNVPEDGVYGLVFRVIITGGSNSFWVRVSGMTTNTGNHASGWVRFNEIPDGDAWHWEPVYSDDDNRQVVEFTLSAGDHTLEIARREDGALLDAIALVK